MGCGPAFEISSLMRDAAYTGQQHQLQALAQQQLQAHLMQQQMYAQQAQMQQAELAARGLVPPQQYAPSKPCPLKLGNCTNCGDCKKPVGATLEGVHIDNAPLLDWLKFRIDKCWHRGIELVEKAMRPADALIQQLKEALGGQDKAMQQQKQYVPTLRHHGKLTGVTLG